MVAPAPRVPPREVRLAFAVEEMRKLLGTKPSDFLYRIVIETVAEEYELTDNELRRAWAQELVRVAEELEG